MDTAPEIVEIEKRAADAKVVMAGVLRDAGCAASTWWRWRHGGVEPKLGTVRRVRDALEKQIGRAPQPEQGRAA
jgi:predicted transcriptional regulator